MLCPDTLHRQQQSGGLNPMGNVGLGNLGNMNNFGGIGGGPLLHNMHNNFGALGPAALDGIPGAGVGVGLGGGMGPMAGLGGGGGGGGVQVPMFPPQLGGGGGGFGGGDNTPMGAGQGGNALNILGTFPDLSGNLPPPTATAAGEKLALWGPGGGAGGGGTNPLHMSLNLQVQLALMQRQQQLAATQYQQRSAAALQALFGSGGKAGIMQVGVGMEETGSRERMDAWRVAENEGGPAVHARVFCVVYVFCVHACNMCYSFRRICTLHIQSNCHDMTIVAPCHIFHTVLPPFFPPPAPPQTPDLNPPRPPSPPLTSHPTLQPLTSASFPTLSHPSTFPNLLSVSSPPLNSAPGLAAAPEKPTSISPGPPSSPPSAPNAR